MRDPRFKFVALVFVLLLGTTTFIISSQAQKGRSNSPPSIPKIWDEEALATLEVPLPNPEFSPKAVPGDYYYRIPVRRIYKGYPVYIPGKEPPGYLDWLRSRRTFGKTRARDHVSKRSRTGSGRERLCSTPRSFTTPWPR